jgi:hypothetical protein
MLLRVTDAPTAKEAERRAQAAAELFLTVHAPVASKTPK